MAGLSLRVGTVPGTQLRAVTNPMRAAITIGVARATIARVQERTNKHPAAMALRAQGVNQYEAKIVAPRGGPGIIRPVRARVLAFVWHGRPVFFSKVNGKGLGPLIQAEARRVGQRDFDHVGGVSTRDLR